MSTRLGTAWDEVDERVGDRPSELLAVSQTHGVVPRSQIADSPPRADEFSKYKACRPGDLVLNRFNAYRGALGVAPVAGMVSPDYLVVRPRDTADARYLVYLLRSHYASSEMTKYMGGIGGNDPDTSGFSRIDVRALNRMEVPEWSAARQRAIADYLDRETARIDALIEEQQRLIELLSERRNAVLSEAFSAGPSTETTRVGRLLSARPSYGVLVPKYVDEGEGVPFVRVGDILNLAPERPLLAIAPEQSNEYSRTRISEGFSTCFASLPVDLTA
ncbi:restriction endonuclease subunit S domain-containing protein [Streptomyces bikiniensis]|uniref:hypothetical protein n=1 Tax=Streptomyces bikiniensis TaxID=1896 RepID=UPI00131A4AF1|nr:hypothetical protein [Streptomyces bikiniensis]